MVSGKTTLAILLALVGVVGLAFVFSNPLLWVLDSANGDEATVVVQDANETVLGTVEVQIADSWEERYVGLSETEQLENDSGMLFVHDSEDTQNYVMREMDFPIDIVFIASDGTITTIHEAPTREQAGTDPEPYSGRAKYVLEVNRGWAETHEVEPGDQVLLPENVTD